jgi:hypothetical protein
MYPGPASRAEIQDGFNDMLTVVDASRDAQDTLGHWLNGSAPFLYSRAEFERRYGRIGNSP